MKRIRHLPLVVVVLCLLVPTFVMARPPDDSSVPDDYLGLLYGDLYIILRDEYGVPILDSYGCVQPTRVEEVDGVLTLVVKQLYTNEVDDIECELYTEVHEDYADATFVQEVDFGRLNLGRSPQAVIDHSFDEAVNAMNSASSIQLDPAGRLLLTIPVEDGDDILKTIDSPLENLALYIKMMKDGHWITEDTSTGGRGRGGSGGPPEGQGPPPDDGPSVEPRPVLSAEAIGLLEPIGYDGLGLVTHQLTNHDLYLAASLLAAAADKSGSFTVDKIVYANSIYGINDGGGLPGEVPDKSYFDFTDFTYSKPYAARSSGPCIASVWVLQPVADEAGMWQSTCVSLVDTDAGARFADVNYMEGTLADAVWYQGEGTANIGGFTQAANDALKVIEFIHNYAVPEDLYAIP